MWKRSCGSAHVEALMPEGLCPMLAKQTSQDVLYLRMLSGGHKPVTMEKTLIWQDEKALESGWLQVDICMRLAFSYYLWKKHFQPPYDESDECRFMRFAAL